MRTPLLAAAPAAPSSRISLVLVALAATAIVACGPADESEEDVASTEAAVCPGGATVRGVDVSYYQGDVDWKKAKKDGIRFGIARVSDGTGYIDPRFPGNWKEMKATGVYRGLYQFFRADESPSAQAKLLVKEVKDAGGYKPGDLPPVLDIETTEGLSDGTIVKRMHAWLEAVDDALDETPMIYTSPGYWSGLGNPKSFAKYDLWVAHWGVSCPTLPSGGFGNFEFWQYTSSGHVAGISGNVDLDKFNGSLADLGKYALGDDDELESIGGEVQSRPIVGKNADGRLQLFAVAPDGELVTAATHDGAWGGWHGLGGDFAGAPAVARMDDGRLMVVARTADGELRRKLQVAPNGAFGAWASIGDGTASRPELVADAGGTLHLFVQADDGSLVHKRHLDQGGWSAWAKLADVPGGLGAPRVVRRAGGRIAVFVRGVSDGELYWLEQVGAGFSPVASLGGDLDGPPTAARNDDGRLAVFARGADGSLMHIHEKSPDGGWTGWKDLGGDVRAPIATMNADGRIEVFAKGADGALHHIVQKAPDGSFGAWKALGGKIRGAPSVGRRSSGRLEVFARGGKGAVLHLLQDKPGVW